VTSILDDMYVMMDVIREQLVVGNNEEALVLLNLLQVTLKRYAIVYQGAPSFLV
jgi:hypothetical protein